MRLPEAIVSERDSRIYNAKMAGMNYREIAAAFNIAPSTAHAGYLREIRRRAKVGRETVQDDVWLHLDQLDRLIARLWPMTQKRTITQQDSAGNEVEIEVPPSLDAVDRVTRILAQKAKIMGYEKDVIMLQSVSEVGPNIGGEMSQGERTSEQLGKELIGELVKHNIISGDVTRIIDRFVSDKDPVDAEVISDSFDLFELESGGSEEVPPPWVTDDEDEYIPGSWVPDEMEDGDSIDKGHSR